MPSDGSSTSGATETGPSQSAELRVVYLATNADTSCATGPDYYDEPRHAVTVDVSGSSSASETYSNAATLQRE